MTTMPAFSLSAATMPTSTVGVPAVTAFFDPETATVTYVVADPVEKRCAIIDSVRDYDAASGRTRYDGADRVLAFVEAEGLAVEWLLETHVHADHLSAAPYLKARTGAPVGIGARIALVQKTFKAVFNAPDVVPDGSQFDRLFEDGDSFSIGGLSARVLHTPGHTPACLSYRVGDAVFVGDTLFMPDFGTARCDFPNGDARTLYRSVRRLLDLPPETRVFVGHDYAPGGRAPAWETTVAEERAANIHVRDGIDEDAFVRLRTGRDATLDMPRLLLPSVQVNMRAGALPPSEDNGIHYIKIPVDTL